MRQEFPQHVGRTPGYRRPGGHILSRGGVVAHRMTVSDYLCTPDGLPYLCPIGAFLLLFTPASDGVAGLAARRTPARTST